MTEWSRRAVLTAGIGSLAVLATASGVLRQELVAEPVHWADDLCENYAINTKSFYAKSVYQYTDAVLDLITDLGVRIVRERVTTGSSIGARQQQIAMLRLAESGVRWHATVANLADWPRAVEATDDALKILTDYYRPKLDNDLPALVHSLGGCNEVDGPVVNGAVDPQWALHARQMQRTLWSRARSHASFDEIPVAGPSTRTDVTSERARRLGDLSAWSDWGNAHMYNRGVSPTKGIDRHLRILRPCFPTAARWFFTETGYNNAPTDTAGATISEDAAATYAIRGICDFFKRDSIYGRFELLDDPDSIDKSTQDSINATAEREAHYGLVAVPASLSDATPDNWRRKPEFYATQRFLRLMDDRGSRPRLSPLDAKIVTHGNVALQTIVAQKRDGRHYVLLWRDVEVASRFPDASRLEVPATSVDIKLRGRRSAAIYAPRYSERPSRTHPARDQVTVDVAGDLVVVELE